MRDLRRHVAGLVRDRRGITALEYGIVAGWLALVVVLGFMHIGASLSGVFTSVGSGL